MGSTEKYDLENGEIAKSISVVKTRESLLRTRSETDVLSSVRFRLFRIFFENVRQVIFGTKLFVLFPAIPMAFVAQRYSYGRPWIFALSLIGLTPLAERLSFLTEQIAYFTGPTVGGLVNATCGNATELIIALFALHKRKIHVLKYSLLGSIISNLLLVLGSSLLCGGIANLNKEQNFDHKQADVNSLVLLLGLLCQTMPLLFNFRSMEASKSDGNSVLQLSRATSILMLLAYVAYLFFQLKTHSQFFGSQQDEGEVDEVLDKETAAIGFWSAFIWLCLMTIIISVLSEYVVGTIEDASETWGISVNFISIIVLPIVGNAAEHAGSIIFAFKNKLDISLGVCMGSASQILMFVVPLCVIVAWIMGIPMNLDFGFLETGCLAFSILLTAFSLQDGSSHYLKGVVLALAYIAIGACFFVQRLPFDDGRNGNKLGSQNESSFVV
ncbi:vacuolar cation/proton exchanger 3-like isoform X1 [Cynara cardunculus var. scolymus]|uniref:vacuolar cation/proton exchanger 3-like isoform X1 n=1 Tax=Cynara cardunculus var. scolymus TaxID=59895 RepID=UPI000D62D486|nr:vacuolar cation/proton exchanger 3-like isoform X1 [Cynara cardunculus var. scolymus]